MMPPELVMTLPQRAWYHGLVLGKSYRMGVSEKSLPPLYSGKKLSCLGLQSPRKQGATNVNSASMPCKVDDILVYNSSINCDHFAAALLTVFSSCRAPSHGEMTESFRYNSFQDGNPRDIHFTIGTCTEGGMICVPSPWACPRWHCASSHAVLCIRSDPGSHGICLATSAKATLVALCTLSTACFACLSDKSWQQ
jgi:hypothetical protein